MKILSKYKKNSDSYLFMGAILTFTAIFIITGCKKFVEVNPPTNRIAGEVVFANNATAASAVTNIYILMPGRCFDGATQLNGETGLSADEFINNIVTNTTLQPYYTNSLSSSFAVPTYWQN